MINTDIVNIIFELLINLFQGFMFVTFCYKILTPAYNIKTNRIAYFVTVFLMFISITGINYIYISFAYIETIVFFVIMIPYCIIFFKDKLFVKILVPISLHVIVYILAFGINYFFSAVIDCDYNYLMVESSIYRYIFVILSNLIFLIVLFLAFNFYKHNYIIMSKKDMLLTLIIPIVSIIIATLSFLVSSNINMSSLDRIVLGLISILILIFTFINFYLIKSISGNYQLRNENLIISKEKELYQNQIESSEIYMQNISMIKHNIKNQLLCIEGLIDNQKYLEAKAMCQSINKDIDINSHFFNTGNIYFDAILNMVNNKVIENSIDLSINCTDNLSFIDGVDLAVLIGNLVDNAIEALFNENKKELKIEVVNKGAYVILSIQNYCTKHILENNPDLVTNKKDSENHGFGLISVRKIVKKYKGDILFNEENNYFMINIMFETPIIPEK